MTVRILAQAPFNYQFKAAQRYFLTGDFIHLNPEVDVQRAELEYILSPHFPYREYVYIPTHPFVTQYYAALNKEVYIETHLNVARPEPVSTIVATITPIEEPAAVEAVPEVVEAPPEPIAPKPVNRFGELSALPNRELRELASKHGIEYKSKTLTIEAIIALEQVTAHDTDTEGS